MTVNECIELVLMFLCSLDPDQSDLLPVFITIVIALQGPAHMETWKIWLYTWVKENCITELQFSAIATGFKAMYYMPP